MRVKRLDERLSELEWTGAQAIDALILSAQDAIVMCAGFEERATEVLRRAVAAGSNEFRVICISYLPRVEQNRFTDIKHLCSDARATCEIVEYDRQEPSGAAERVLAAAGTSPRIFIDISGMSRLLIVQLIAEAVRRVMLCRISVVYTEAREYPPARDEFDAKLESFGDAMGVTMFLSAGIFGVTVVPELSSVAMQGQPIRLVVFPSWNPTQMAAVCAEMQASYYTVIHVSPLREQDQWRREAMSRLNRIDSLPSPDEVSVSALDHRETLRVLLDLYRRGSQREKVVISPTGTKMQAVAVGLACGWLRDLQVVYPTPKDFLTPMEYTRGVTAMHALPLTRYELPADEGVFDPDELA